jgi:NAD(P)-dependent dehydrogenase (short-subunit alcohol dehydrogenase family)
MRVNSVAPGVVDTQLWAKNKAVPGVVETIENQTTLRRWARPDDIADVMYAPGLHVTELRRRGV